MRTIFCFSVLMLALTPLFGYQNRIGITVGNRDITVNCIFSLSNDTVRITLPMRAHLTGVQSPGIANVNFNNSRNTVLIGSVQSTYQGKIRIVYTLPVAGSEFSVSDWMPLADEKGETTATIQSPAGQLGMFLPYRKRVSDGYVVDPSDQPLLFSGRFQAAEEYSRGRAYEIVYLGRMEDPLSNVARQLEGFEKWLFPLAAKRIVLIELPAARNTVRSSGDSLFIVVNGTRREEINRAFASLYFRSVLGWNEDYSAAFTDLYKRIIDEGGELKRDDAEWIAVPRDEYYQKILKNGFGRTELDRCDAGGLLWNFALLHFCYYTVGLKPFLEGIRSYLSETRAQPAGLDPVFTNSGDALQAVRFAGSQLLPKAKSVPDLILKGPVVYRSTDRIPDVSVLVNGEVKEILWDGKRAFDLKTTNGTVIVDPFRLIPQLDFYNDRGVYDPEAAAEREIVARAVSQHRHFPDETFRGFLDLNHLPTPAGNAFSLATDRPFYIAVVKFTAPVNGRLVEGLKELVLTVETNTKVKVLAERVRY